MLACAAAADAGARLFVLNGPDIISEFLGESEAGLQVSQGPKKTLMICTCLLEGMICFAWFMVHLALSKDLSLVLWYLGHVISCTRWVYRVHSGLPVQQQLKSA